MSFTSTPSLLEFNPYIIPFQGIVVNDVREKLDYKLGVHELLLSGSVGSSKSILMAHLGLTHCLMYPGARFLLARRALPDLRDTLVKKVTEHIGNDLVEGKDYEYNKSRMSFNFYNNSEMICRSWADLNYKKLRSLELSGAAVEELTENDNEEFDNFHTELLPRVNRMPHVPEKFVAYATNPDAPSHRVYEYFNIGGRKNSAIKYDSTPLRHVYFSKTSDNPFLDQQYISQLLEIYTKEEALRMIEGEWIEIKREVIYYAFNESTSVVNSYQINPKLPICITADFNIGMGKPMSWCIFQFDGKRFYFFDELIMFGTDTEEAVNELIERKLFDYPTKYLIFGDAAGKSISTKSKQSDYDIIEKVLARYRYINGDEEQVKVAFEIDVPVNNPPVRTRHTIVNGQLRNALGDTNIFLVKDKCPMTIKGLRLAKLKKGGQYIEDDSDAWQHSSAALGYGVLRQLERVEILNNFYTRKY